MVGDGEGRMVDGAKRGSSDEVRKRGREGGKR